MGASAQSAPAVGGGVMAGKWNPPDQEEQTVTVSYHSEVRGRGTMTIVLGPEGERFRGEYVRLDAKAPNDRVVRIYTTWTRDPFDRYSTGPLGQEFTREATLVYFRKHYEGSVVATLAGDRGNLIRCRFELDRADKGLPGGASGRCQISSGGTIDVSPGNRKPGLD
jgi:hypothetical protein